MASAATNTNTVGSTNGSVPENPSPSSQDSPMDDPLFLHHAENPSLVLVTQPNWWRKLLSLGSSCEKGIAHQE